MTTLEDIDREIRRLTGENDLCRPFLCPGSPIGCEVAEVGINPGTDTPFWPYWNVQSGCDKEGWLSDYLQRHGGLNPTRDRIEVLARNLAPLRLLELNLYHHYSPDLNSLGREHRDTELFDYMLEIANPRILVVHGDKPAKHLECLLGVSLPKTQFTPAAYRGKLVDVYRAIRHFKSVSRNYIASIADEIKKRLGAM